MERLKPTLTDVLTADRWWFGQFGESLINDLPTRHLIYQDNGANILGVGHIDTVEDHRSANTEATIAAHETAMKLARFQQTGPQLDDRLGVWALLSVLPEHMKFDMLLTDNEEIGMSTALDFEPPGGKRYNWIFELDRRGDGCVLYQYGSKKWNRELQQAGLRIDKGSFSDIGYLDHLGVQAVNIGIGYDHEHTLACDWDVDVTRSQLQKLVNFYSRNKDKRYAYSRHRSNFVGTRSWASRINGTLHKPVTSSKLYTAGDEPKLPYWRGSYWDIEEEEEAGLDSWKDAMTRWDDHNYTQPEPKSDKQLVKLVNGREYLYNGFAWTRADDPSQK
jgi:hypothetical protein